MSIPISGRLAVALALLCVASPGAAPAQQLEVTGRVLDRRGALAQARVELQVLHPVHRLAELQISGELHPRIVARSRTDRDGELRLTAPSPGFWKVVVHHPEYLPASRDLSPLLDDFELADVVLPRRSELAARLVDATGEPVAGVTLVVGGWSAEWKDLAADGWWPAERRVRTGPGGSAAVPCAPGEKLSVAALDGERFLYRVAECDAGLLELRLEEGLRTARLVGPGGVPAAGAYSFLLRPFLAFGASAEGGLVRGPFDLQGSVPVVFADSEAFYGEPVRSAPGEQDAEEASALELPATEPLRGRLVDAFDGRPVAGAWLWVGRGSHHFQALAPDGEFRLRLRTGDPRPLFFGAPGYLSLAYDSPAAVGEELLARISPAMILRGRVVDPVGVGIADAVIRGRKPRLVRPATRHAELRAGGRWILGDIEGVTDASGSFELRGLAPSMGFGLRVACSGFATRHRAVPPLMPGAPSEELVIMLDPGATGFGQVLNEREMPIGGAEVALLPALTGSAAEQDFGASESFSATTDAEGGFTLRDLPLGTYYLSARSRGFPELLVPGIEISESAEPIDLGTVILVPGVLLSGRVVDPEGEAVADAQLSLRNADGEQIVVQRAESSWFASATSRQNGSFHLEGLPRHSRLTLLAVADGFLPRVVAVTIGVEDQELNLELSAGARVSGVVLDPRGRGAAAARVRVRPSPQARRLATSTSRNVTTDPEGRFEAAGLRPGEYDLEAMSDGAASDRVRRTVTAEGIADLYLQLRQKPALVVSVLDAEGEPLSRAWRSR